MTNHRDFFPNAFQVTQPNQFSKLYVIIKGINKNCKSIKEFSRFIMRLAHAVQSAGSARKTGFSPSTLPLIDLNVLGLAKAAQPSEEKNGLETRPPLGREQTEESCSRELPSPWLLSCLGLCNGITTLSVQEALTEHLGCTKS